MTEKLYYKDSHLSEFKAIVIGVKENAVILDKTAFFPEGGGQTADTGVIDGVRVLDVQIVDGEILHYLEKPIEIGKTVECKLSFDKRFYKMQNHSGEHIISGIVHSLYGYDNVGFHLNDTEMTMDFNGPLNREDLLKVEKLANEAIYKNAKFTCFFPEDLNGLEYRSKLDLTEDVRIVEIEGYDRCACCAPHVDTACEIGIIKILDFCKNKGGVRLFVKCGYSALEDYNERYMADLKISSLLCSPQNEIALAVEKLQEQMGEQKFKMTDLKRRFISEKAKNFETEKQITAVFEEDFDIKELQLFSDALYKKSGGIRGVFSQISDGFSFAICGESEKLDEFFAKFKNTFNVKGGGRNGMVQGTVFANETEIVKFFNKSLLLKGEGNKGYKKDC